MLLRGEIHDAKVVRLNIKVEERSEEREEKLRHRKARNFMREISELYINSEQLTIVWVGWKKTIRNLTTSK